MADDLPGAALAPAPGSLADPQSGRPAFGRYAGRVADVSTRRWDGTLGLASPRRLQRKTWLYLGAFSPRLMVGFAVVDAGLLGTAFVYVFDRERRTLIEEKLTVPLGFPADFAGSLQARWALARGARRWLITPEARGWRAEFASDRLQLAMSVGAPVEGMTTIAPAPGRPFNSTYKNCGLRVHVALRRDGEDLELDADGMVDFTLGYPPRRTFWNWAAFAGTSADGRRVGLNLVAHFNNGLENALWLGERVVPLGQANFVYDPAKLDAPWRLTTADGIVDLHFTPEGRRAEHLDALFMGSRFVQLFGRFEGTVRDGERRVPVSAYGVTEEHWATW